MINWFASQKGAIALSIIAMLSFVGYALLEFRYFLGQWTPGTVAATWQTLFVLVLVGGWLWALFSVGSGSRGALIVALVIGALPALIALYDIILYSPIPYGWPLVQIAVWTMLISSVVAIVAVALQLRR